ncbi:hypothetical protein CXG81DRAFT_17344 [Caulochytrium protostelioides]|uniref:Uncharacterized protein n=1 Tax=Caulochytrium protostelioides TaxID=1555241 RepID=A0A4V1IV76_9FUNG|nr:hypothetical protein CXG81DRAFT_17344 [Caulochytrium protostelioides]|eukprot:RKP03089.1 hypothetical protein CXG81DRAFT_17344 [Caulochytrium protostelioides]
MHVVDSPRASSLTRASGKTTPAAADPDATSLPVHADHTRAIASVTDASSWCRPGNAAPVAPYGWHIDGDDDDEGDEPLTEALIDALVDEELRAYGKNGTASAALTPVADAAASLAPWRLGAVDEGASWSIPDTTPVTASSLWQELLTCTQGIGTALPHHVPRDGDYGDDDSSGDGNDHARHDGGDGGQANPTIHTRQAISAPTAAFLGSDHHDGDDTIDQAVRASQVETATAITPRHGIVTPTDIDVDLDMEDDSELAAGALAEQDAAWQQRATWWDTCVQQEEQQLLALCPAGVPAPMPGTPSHLFAERTPAASSGMSLLVRDALAARQDDDDGDDAGAHILDDAIAAAEAYNATLESNIADAAAAAQTTAAQRDATAREQAELTETQAALEREIAALERDRLAELARATTLLADGAHALAAASTALSPLDGASALDEGRDGAMHAALVRMFHATADELARERDLQGTIDVLDRQRSVLAAGVAQKQATLVALESQVASDYAAFTAAATTNGTALVVLGEGPTVTYLPDLPPELTSISLDRIGMQMLPLSWRQATFAGLLTSLTLTNQELRQVQLDFLPMLTELDVSGNAGFQPHQCTFPPRLMRLALRHTGLTNHAFAQLLTLPLQLEALDVRHNAINHYNATFPLHQLHTARIDLRENQLTFAAELWSRAMFDDCLLSHPRALDTSIVALSPSSPSPSAAGAAPRRLWHAWRLETAFWQAQRAAVGNRLDIAWAQGIRTRERQLRQCMLPLAGAVVARYVRSQQAVQQTKTRRVLVAWRQWQQRSALRRLARHVAARHLQRAWRRRRAEVQRQHALQHQIDQLDASLTAPDEMDALLSDLGALQSTFEARLSEDQANPYAHLYAQSSADRSTQSHAAADGPEPRRSSPPGGACVEDEAEFVTLRRPDRRDVAQLLHESQDLAVSPSRSRPSSPRLPTRAPSAQSHALNLLAPLPGIHGFASPDLKAAAVVAPRPPLSPTPRPTASLARGGAASPAPSDAGSRRASSVVSTASHVTERLRAIAARGDDRAWRCSPPAAESSSLEVTYQWKMERNTVVAVAPPPREKAKAKKAASTASMAASAAGAAAAPATATVTATAPRTGMLAHIPFLKRHLHQHHAKPSAAAATATTAAPSPANGPTSVLPPVTVVPAVTPRAKERESPPPPTSPRVVLPHLS